jgi:hypothetical protein
MRNGIAAILGAASLLSLAACESNVVQQPPSVDLGAAGNNTFNLRYQVDAARERIWWLTREGVFIHSAAAPEKIPVSLPGWLWAGAAYSCLPDLALGPRGEAVVTSNVLPVLWKIDPETLAVSVHRLQLDADADKDVGFSGLAYSARDGAYIAVSELHGSLWRIDPLLRRAQKIALSEPVRACKVSVQRQERPVRFSRLCLEGRSVNLAPDQRSAYVQSAGCASSTFTVIGGIR